MHFIIFDSFITTVLAALSWVLVEAKKKDQTIFGAVGALLGRSAEALREEAMRFISRHYMDLQGLDVDGHGRAHYGIFLFFRFFFLYA